MEDQQDTNLIETPLSLLPDLGKLGIEEADKGVCADTAENRRIIRENKMRYQPVYSSEGKLTDLIQVITPEMRTAALSASKGALLVDDRNVNSDYITGIMLIIDPSADYLVPAWVLAATRHWLDVAEKRKTVPKFRPALAGPPARCTALRIDGGRCASWSNGTAEYGGFCRTHLTNRPNGEDASVGHLAKARQRLQSAASAAVDELERLMDSAISEPVRLGAARDILDRAGIRGGIEVDTQGTVMVPAADPVPERLDQPRPRNAARQEIEAKMFGGNSGDTETDPDVVDAEIVEEPDAEPVPVKKVAADD